MTAVRTFLAGRGGGRVASECVPRPRGVSGSRAQGVRRRAPASQSASFPFAIRCPANRTRQARRKPECLCVSADDRCRLLAELGRTSYHVVVQPCVPLVVHPCVPRIYLNYRDHPQHPPCQPLARREVNLLRSTLKARLPT